MKVRIPPNGTRNRLYCAGLHARQTRAIERRHANFCRSPEVARRTAERLAASKAGVVAFSTSGDVELGEYDDEPVVFFKTGRLPAQFDDQ